MNYELGGIELVIEWRCWREDGSYGPPCQSPSDRVEHKWDHRHWDCCWIGYVELGQNLEPNKEVNGMSIQTLLNDEEADREAEAARLAEEERLQEAKFFLATSGLPINGTKPARPPIAWGVLAFAAAAILGGLAAIGLILMRTAAL